MNTTPQQEREDLTYAVYTYLQTQYPDKHEVLARAWMELRQIRKADAPINVVCAMVIEQVTREFAQQEVKRLCTEHDVPSPTDVYAALSFYQGLCIGRIMGERMLSRDLGLEAVEYDVC